VAALLARLGRSAARRAWIVLAAWIGALAIAVGGFLAFGGALSSNFSIPGTATDQVTQRLEAALPVLLFTAAILFVIGILGFLLFGGAFAPALLSGRQPSESALAGIGFAMLILVPLFLLFIVWLAARLCCTGPIMADKRTFNVLTGLSESWRITGAAQWKIFAYFILLGIAFLVIAMILGAVVGFSVFASGGMPGAGSMVGLIVGSIVMSIPVAYLQVGIPAGIYRALGPVDAGSVFA